jgi:hypothetical protein
MVQHSPVAGVLVADPQLMKSSHIYPFATLAFVFDPMLNLVHRLIYRDQMDTRAEHLNCRHFG